MAIEPISAIQNGAPVLVLDRVSELTRPIVRVVDATEVIGENSVRNLPGSIVENLEEGEVSFPTPEPPSRAFVSDDLLASSIEEANTSAVSNPEAFKLNRPRIPYDRLVLYGTLYIDVIV